MPENDSTTRLVSKADAFLEEGAECARSGKTEKAKWYYRRAAEMLEGLAQETAQEAVLYRYADCYEALGRLSEGCGELRNALQYYARMLSIREQIVPQAAAAWYLKIAEGYRKLSLLSERCSQPGQTAGFYRKAEKYHLLARVSGQAQQESELAARFSQLSEENRQLRSRLEASEKECRELAAGKSLLHYHLDDAEQTRQKLTAENSRLRSELAESRQHCQELEDRNMDSARQLAAAVASNQELEEAQSQLRHQIAELRKQLRDSQAAQYQASMQKIAEKRRPSAPAQTAPSPATSGPSAIPPVIPTRGAGSCSVVLPTENPSDTSTTGQPSETTSTSSAASSGITTGGVDGRSASVRSDSISRTSDDFTETGWLCPVCGNWASFSSKVCSHCGYSRSSAASTARSTPSASPSGFTTGDIVRRSAAARSDYSTRMPDDFTETGWICPSCGNGVSFSSKICPRCGYSRAPAKAAAGWTCPNCGSSCSAGMLFCARCGTRKPAQTAPAGWTCPACGATCSANMRFCAHCGTKKPAQQTESLEISRVEFSAVAPKTFIKGEYTLLHVIMYEREFRKVVDQLIAEAEVPVHEERKGTFEVGRHARIRIELTSPDLAIEDNVEEQTWEKEHLDFSFAIMLPRDYTKQQILFIARIYINGLIATRLQFIAQCSTLREQKIEITREDVLSAFISYASQDRNRVAGIVQGMKNARRDMDIFFDVTNIESGEYWEKILRSEIEKRDILFLCWSNHARNSEWVDKEWRYALACKGEDCIEPIPLESPTRCPPPAELKDKHFNDYLLYIMNTES